MPRHWLWRVIFSEVICSNSLGVACYIWQILVWLSALVANIEVQYVKMPANSWNTDLRLRTISSKIMIFNHNFQLPNLHFKLQFQILFLFSNFNQILSRTSALEIYALFSFFNVPELNLQKIQKDDKSLVRLENSWSV